MKLLQINVTSNWGSTGKIAEQIGQCAIRHGWESYVAYGRMHNPSQNKTIRIGSMADVYLHYAEQRIFDNEGLASRRATRNFLSVIDDIKPDIVHLHIIHDHYINYRLLFKYLTEKKIPVVWTQHDQWATTGHCMYTPDNCERWKIECHDCPLGNEYPKTVADRSLKNFRLKKALMTELPSLTIVPVSNWLGDNIKQSHLKNHRIEVIHNGIDVEIFSPHNVDVHKRYGIESKKQIVLAVASIWEKRKGLPDVLKLATLLNNKEFAIVVVGKITEKPNIPSRGCQIVFVDRTQNAKELAELYSSALVFINPTYQDNFPTVNLEALACGTPVITYRTGGSPEAVDTKTGIVVEQGDVEAMASAIRKIKENPLSSNDCRAKAVSEFDKNICFEKYIQLYNDIINNIGNK